MGKGGLNEEVPQYGGIHQGAGTHPGVAEALRRADFVLWIGNYPPDFNTGDFTTIINKSTIIVEFQRFSVSVGEITYLVTMKYVLQALTKEIQQNQLSKPAPKVDWNPYPESQLSVSDDLKQDFLGRLSALFSGQAI